MMHHFLQLPTGFLGKLWVDGDAWNVEIRELVSERETRQIELMNVVERQGIVFEMPDDGAAALADSSQTQLLHHGCAVRRVSKQRQVRAWNRRNGMNVSIDDFITVWIEIHN